MSGGSGGAERVAADFSSRLGNNWNLEKVFAGSVVKGVRLSGTQGPSWWRSIQFVKQVDKLIDKIEPDVVLSFERGPCCDIYRAGDGVHRRWMQIKYGSSPRWILNPLNWAYPYLEKKSVRSAGVVVANSEMAARDLRQAYPREKDKVHVIRNGFDPSRFNPGPADVSAGFDLPQDARVFLFLGSGWERKGLKAAIHFIAELSRNDPSFRDKGRLLVVGDGDSRPYLQEADRLGVKDKVLFLGAVSNPANFCRVAELMVLPTRYDPFSNATLEALACGCPVLTTRSNGAAEVIDHGRTGLVFGDSKEKDASVLAQEFLQTSFDPRESIAESVAGMTREAELTRYEELLNEIVHSKEAGGG